MPLLADFPRAMSLGFSMGTQMGEGQNPLGNFVRSMLADWQQRRVLQTEYGMKKGLLEEEYKLKSKYPDPLMAILAKQYGIDITGKGEVAPTTDLGVTGLSFGKAGARIELGETPEQKQKREVETAMQKKAEEARTEMTAVDNMATAVWDAANRLIPAPITPKEAERKGLERKAKGISIFGIRPQRAFGISDEDALAFEQIKRGEATPLIRSLGEKGMLTNQDIQRALELMPGLSDSQQLRQTKKRELSTFLQSKIKAYYKSSSEQANILTKEIAIQILQETGGDRDRARELAKQRGYQF